MLLKIIFYIKLFYDIHKFLAIYIFFLKNMQYENEGFVMLFCMPCYYLATLLTYNGSPRMVSAVVNIKTPHNLQELCAVNITTLYNSNKL